jgi:hypothetical protein
MTHDGAGGSEAAPGASPEMKCNIVDNGFKELRFVVPAGTKGGTYTVEVRTFASPSYGGTVMKSMRTVKSPFAVTLAEAAEPVQAEHPVS